MNILLTGATSFLGLAVSRALLRRGIAVYAPVRQSSVRASLLPVHPAFHCFSGDLGDAAAFGRAGLPQMDVCVDFAWSGVGVKGRMNPEIQAENVKNTLSLIREAHSLGCRLFLFAGSQAEYGITEERVKSGLCGGSPVTEETVCRPVSEYGKGKREVLLQGAELCGQLGMEYVHLRIFSVYGPGDHETSLVSTCVKAALQGRKADLGPCSQLWNFLYADDLAEAVCALACSASCPGGQQIYNVGSLDTRPLKDFVRDIFSARGNAAAASMLYEFHDRPAGPEGTPYLSPDISKLIRDTGFKPAVPFSEGIRRIMAAEKKGE